MTVKYGRPIGGKGVQDVSVQDPFSDTLILPLANQTGLTTLTVATIVEDYTVTVASTVGADLIVGNHLRIINAGADKYYAGTILAINGLDITVDGPLDAVYMVGSEVTFSNINMALADGSVTPIHFHLRTGTPSIPSSIDITRMLMVCETSGAVDLNKFGDIAGGLTRGLTFRKENGAIRNIWNVKQNRELVGLAYDFNVYTASNPAQGINGFSWRLTFGSSGKMGTVLRITQDGQLGLIVQDDLTDLVSLTCIVEGHVVTI